MALPQDQEYKCMFRIDQIAHSLDALLSHADTLEHNSSCRIDVMSSRGGVTCAKILIRLIADANRD